MAWVASEAFRAARLTDSLNEGPPHHLALAHYALGNHAEAMKSLTLALNLAPRDARLHLLQANILLATKNLAQAAEAVNVGLQIESLPVCSLPEQSRCVQHRFARENAYPD
jgi:Flp pilus assembly protein TadD